MKLVDQSIKNPVTVIVGVIFIILFGFLSFFRIPVQLTPNVDKPEITVTTLWEGSSPQEMEREIIDEQEDQLKSLDSLVEMKSQSNQGRGNIILTFSVGTDMDSALLKVSNKLNQVEEYPDESKRPIITNVSQTANAMAWFVLKNLPGYDNDIYTLRDFIEDYITPYLERVPGVASSNVFGGMEREMQVILDLDALAARGVTVQQVATALSAENKNISGGDFDGGKRSYIVRTIGEFKTPEDVENVIIARPNGASIYLRDIAKVKLGYKDPYRSVRVNGKPTIALNCLREAGSNVLTTMEGIKEAARELNSGVLADKGLQMVQVYDETEYINSSISLVEQNLMAGGILAIIVLLIFLRSVITTLVIALAIPISVVGTFLMVTLLGRSLNMISLAGMCFAVGMVVDASIVVLENIYRHRQMGKPRMKAAYEGTVEVWGAVLASTLTTMAVFLPVIFVKEEVGQLFRDIAVAISCAVALSLIVSITVIPTLSSRLLRRVRGVGTGLSDAETRKRKSFGNLWGLSHWPERFPEFLSGLIYKLCGSTLARIGIVAALTIFSIGLSWALMPDTEYLPTGNRNLILGILLPPPGYSIEEVTDIGIRIEKDLSPYWEAEEGSELAKSLKGPLMRDFFYVARGNEVFMGSIAKDPNRAREMMPVLKEALTKIPGMIAIVMQTSLFERELMAGRSIDVEITGPDLVKLVTMGYGVFGQALQALPGSQVRPIPSLELGHPEVQVIPDRDRAADLGISSRDIGFIVRAVVDGVKASEYKLAGDEIDLTVVGEDHTGASLQKLENLPIRSSDGRLLNLGSVARVVSTTGPDQINHLERKRGITIRISPPDEMPLESAMNIVQQKIVAPLRASGQLGDLYDIRVAGTADKLTTTRKALQGNFLLAMLITYLLMSSLFESFLYPFVIMFSVPLAAIGGFMGLFLVSRFVALQQLDVISMLGFIILIGIVVNNAILIVHQALNNVRYGGMTYREGIRESVRTRIRPIFMSTTTSVFGMLPLVLVTGPGSELYRGLGSVVVGGLVTSTLFTLILTPLLFSLVIDAKERLVAAFAKRKGAEIERTVPGESIT